MRRTTFVVLSFEGPDAYARAGGLGSRVTELSGTLARMGFETHLVFVGDPALPPVETREDGRLVLHRWSQWISRHHPAGVYAGEDVKVADWDRSLAPWLERELLAPRADAGGTVVVLAEEWQTTGTVIALRRVVERRGWGARVRLLWNLNNMFGTGRIDWPALGRSAVITTVSRFMKHEMWRCGVNARVVPNGIDGSWLAPPDGTGVAALSRAFDGRLALAKVARWDPDKRWNMAVDAVAALKRQGRRPLLVARGGGGGGEGHGAEVLARARSHRLTVLPVMPGGTEPMDLARAVGAAAAADIVLIEGFLNQNQLKILNATARAVLANSGIEPFGLVGLEAMACGGLAFVGATGEDYATPGHDCIAVQTDDPGEIAFHAVRLQDAAAGARALRRNAVLTARRYLWPAVVTRALLPVVSELGGQHEPMLQEPVQAKPAWPLAGSVGLHALAARRTKLSDNSPNRTRVQHEP